MKTTPTDEEELYAQAAAELEDGNRDEGLWAKCFAECDGEENKAKARYIKTRVQRLGDGNDTASKGNEREMTSQPEPASGDKEGEPREVEFAYADVKHPTIGCLFSKAWKSFSAEPWRHIAYYFVFLIAGCLMIFIPFVGWLFLPAVYGGYMGLLMQMARAGKSESESVEVLGGQYKSGRKRFNVFLGAGLLIFFAKLIGAVLFFPIFYVMTISFFVFPLLLDSEIGVFGAFRKSISMTKGAFWKVLSVTLVVLVMEVLSLFTFGLTGSIAILMQVHYYFALRDGMELLEAKERAEGVDALLPHHGSP